MSIHICLLLLLATSAAASQAITQNIKPHLPARDVLPTVVVPGRYKYKGPEARQAVGVASSGHEVIVDSRARRGADAGRLFRRGDGQDQASLLEMEDKVESKRDLYVMIGKNLCDGGGLWKRYELNSVVPGKYEHCAPACDLKDECVGFDVGNSGCNLYTQKAVAMGTWPYVRSNGPEPFAGQGDHDDYPATPLELTVGASDFGKHGNFKCYRKSYYKPANSFFRKIGNGKCAGGGLWKRYKLTGGTEAECEHACSVRDECIGFDAGHADCFLYAQKQVFGLWVTGVATEPEAGEEEHNVFPATPYDLVANPPDSPSATDGSCWAKTHWVSLASYYMELGKQTCTGGGKWKHYKLDSGSIDDCKTKCDEKDECVGLDFSSAACQLYTSKEVSGWTGVAGPTSGEGVHAEEFPPTGFALSPDTAAAADGTFCLAKTHTMPPAENTATAQTATPDSLHHAAAAQASSEASHEDGALHSVHGVQAKKEADEAAAAEAKEEQDAAIAAAAAADPNAVPGDEPAPVLR